MSQFSLPRFRLLVQYDALRMAKPVLYGTVALLGLTVFIHLRQMKDPVHIVLYGFYLVIGGMLLTSVAFRDLHHPLQRYQYLMLPCSNLERLLSRYLLTGPAFALYGTLAFVAIDHVASLLTRHWVDWPDPQLSPFAPETRQVILGYLLAHVATLVGAICFRSHALAKTMLFLMLVTFGGVVVENVAERAMFPDFFSWTQFDNVHPFPLQLEPWFIASWMNVLLVIGTLAWIFFIAWLCLRDHEVTDGL